MGVGSPELQIDPVWRQRMISGLKSGQHTDGGFGVHPYSKWKGSHWRLVSLVELGVASDDAAAHAAAEDVLRWSAASSEPLVMNGRGVECRSGGLGDAHEVVTPNDLVVVQ